MKKIEEYTVCRGEGPLALTRSVMHAIRDGWTPHGSMVIDATFTFYQPMVRLVEDDKEPEK